LPASKKLRISAPAQQNLKDIATYTKTTWGNKQAQHYLKQLRQSFDRLCIEPNLGKPYPDIDQTLQSHLCQKHIIFYRINGNTLNIIRILHQSMDIEKHLR